ncbi:MAG TPA: PRC-barrel domain-containing protein [Verrucomicrobiae bacterium]|nr:PRC-barrel domain-containing protein [Verrucomicrobiae bacterium]
MNVRNTTLAALSFVLAAGCMHNRQQADFQQGGSSPPEFAGTTTAQASAPAQPDQAAPDSVERADKLIGEPVLSSDQQRTGKIDDFVLDQDSGRILYAVIGIGGVLGVGETRVAVPPGAFTQAKKGDVRLKVDKHKVTQAPQITRDLDQNLSTNLLNNVDGYFGQTPSWQPAAGSTTAWFKAVRKASELIGVAVLDKERQSIGKVQTLVLNVPRGRELFVVLAPGSELNLGNNYYALPPSAVKLAPDQKTLLADVTREKLANAPHFAKDNWPELSDTAWAQKVYQYYGQPATFETGTLQPTGRTQTSAPDQKH